MLVVDASRPWTSVAELTAYLKQKGAKASYATSNPPAKVMGALYKARAGLEAVEVPYRTSFDTVNDMQSGALDYALYDPVFATAQAREGRMRILAVSTGARTRSNPELPTMTESGVPMDLLGWFAAMVPMGTPRPIVDEINRWFNALDATAEARQFLNSIGGDPWIATPEEGQARFLRDIQDWGDYVRTARIEPQG
jgi:tripartite-type tricarboxylate transporter receptor subunit TctC